MHRRTPLDSYTCERLPRRGKKQTQPPPCGSRRGSPPTPPQAPPQLRTLVQIWVEALDGRRPVESLRRGPFTAEVIDHLRSRVSEWQMRGTVAASILKSVHLQPCEVGKIRFTATIEAGERVRAISGSLQKLRVRPTRALHELHIGKPAKREYRWRVDSMLLI